HPWPEQANNGTELTGPGASPQPQPPGPAGKSPTTMPSAADALDRKKIPLQLLAQVGGGDPDHAPPELVAVLGGVPFQHTGLVGDVCFSPDDKFLVTAHSDVNFWDLVTGGEQFSFG